MFPRTAALGFVLVMSACAGANRNTPVKLESPTGSPGLFVGHSQHGEVVVAATHYRAMIGLATTDVDLGLTPRKYGSGEMLPGGPRYRSGSPAYGARGAASQHGSRRRCSGNHRSGRVGHADGAALNGTLHDPSINGLIDPDRKRRAQ
jgi:hypothetical protein